MDPTEHRLLSAYVNDQNEDAFRQLVEQHLDMVYHTALRRTGLPSMAEDVSQQVFTILAKKAPRLKAGFGLGGWLHRTTLFEASRTLRSERRRAAKMKELASQAIDSPEASSWNEALPVLDEAIESLSDKDRKAIILRFFEDQSFQAIGKALGKSEDASQKQVSRALEKLGLVLRRQGFAASTVALGTLLSSEATKAAPAALQQSITQASLAAVPNVATAALISNTILTMTYAKTKTAILVTAIASIPMGLQWNKIQTLESQLKDVSPRSDYTAKAAEVEQLETKLATAEASLTEIKAVNETLLAKASGNTEKQPGPGSNLADMFEDPAMQVVIRQQIRTQVMSTFGDLLETFDLTDDEVDSLEATLTDKLMIGATKGMKIMDKSLSSDERKALTASLKQEMETVDDSIRETYGDEIADKVKLYEESTSERQELAAFKAQAATKGLEIPFETEEQLMAIMYEERKAFKFTHQLNDNNDPSVLAELNDETFASIEAEYAQLHERIRGRVSELLDSEALETFQANQASFSKLMVNSMKMSQQMLGGGE